MTEGSRSSKNAALLAFITAGITLFSQVLVHRVISAKLLNNYAFLVISLTMLGFAFSGAVLSVAREKLLARRDDVIAWSAGLFALSLLGTCWAFYRAETAWGLVETRADFLQVLLARLPVALPFALPFAFTGLILGILLASTDLDARRVYCFDLAGSGAGAFLVIPAIVYSGVERNLEAACLIMIVAAFLLTRASPGARAFLGISVLITVGAGVMQDRIFDMRYPAGALAHAQGPGAQVRIEQILWDPISRVELSSIPPITADTLMYPALVGDNPDFLRRLHKMITQNNYAFTLAADYDGRPESLNGIEETIYAAAYEARAVTAPRVLAIGVGGGFDILTALAFGAREVTGVEVNAATLKILKETDREYFHHWVDDPRVKLVLAEGRNYLATTDQRFDVLQLSGVDSYAGTPGAAHVFSESYLYTAEAMDLYLSRLSDQGILNLMRVEYRPPREMLRALMTAVEALRRAGVSRPADHIVMIAASNGGFTAMLVKRTPFRAVEVERLAEWAGKSPYFEVAAAPGLTVPDRNLYQGVLSLHDPRKEELFAQLYPFDIRPVPDDRPFFFKYSYWSHLFTDHPLLKVIAPVMEMSVLVLLVLIGGAAVICVYLPLRVLQARSAHAPGTFRYGVYFAAAGLGYLAIEMAILQKFGLFLGHPNYALSVVLAALLISSGAGSLFSEPVVRSLGGTRFVSYAVAALLILGKLLVLPYLALGLTLPFWTRVAITFTLTAPVGFLLGTFVPSGLESLKHAAPAFVPWAWGINGIFSVLAPVLAIAFSMTWGIDALLLAAIPIYLIAGWVLPREPGVLPAAPVEPIAEGSSPQPV